MGRTDRLAATAAGDASDEVAVEARGEHAETAVIEEHKRLSNPEEQMRIMLQPDKIDYRLRLTEVAMDEFVAASPFKSTPPGWSRVENPNGGMMWEKEISLPMQLSHAQAFRRRTLDLLEAFTKALYLEMSQFAPNGEATMEWIASPRGLSYLDVAAAAPRVRSAAREVICALSRASMSEVEEGMDSADLIAILLQLNLAVQKSMKDRGNVNAPTTPKPTASASVGAPSLPASGTTTT